MSALGRATLGRATGRLTGGTVTLGTVICTGVLGTETVTGGVGGISTGDLVGTMGRVGCGGWTPVGGEVGGIGSGVVGLDDSGPDLTGFCAAGACDSGEVPGSLASILVVVLVSGPVLLALGRSIPPCGLSHLPKRGRPAFGCPVRGTVLASSALTEADPDLRRATVWVASC